MQSKVISEKLTGWFPDGFTRESLKVGDVRDFGDATSGLMQADMIEPADYVEEVKAEERAVVVPAVVIEDALEEPVVDTDVEPVVASVVTEKRQYNKNNK